jgi:hypothetical protein
MNKIPNPFSLYDFLGYFLPGAIVVYAIALLIGHTNADTSVATIYEKFLSLKEPGVILPFILLSYIAGHLASYLSSITVERYSTLQYGQPSKYVLGVSHTPYFFTGLRKGPIDPLRILLGIFMTPVAIFDLAFGRGLGLARVYARGLDKVLQAVLRQSVTERLNAISQPKGVKPEETKAEMVEFFLLLQHFALENCEHHRPKMDNYVALYGFLRTMTLLLLLLFWMFALHVLIVGPFKYLPYGAPLTVALVAFVFYMAYMKFWRRYSLEVLMAIAVHSKSQSAKST